MATNEEILGFTLEQLEAMTDEELQNHFSKLLVIQELAKPKGKKRKSEPHERIVNLETQVQKRERRKGRAKAKKEQVLAEMRQMIKEAKNMQMKDLPI